MERLNLRLRIRCITTAVPILIVIAIGALALGGCGSSDSGSSSGNGAVIHQAQQGEQSQSSIQRQLDAKLDLYRSSSYDDKRDTFDVGANGQCSIEVVATGAEASMYKGDEWAVFSPDNSAAVKIAPTTPTPASQCMAAVVQAMGW